MKTFWLYKGALFALGLLFTFCFCGIKLSDHVSLALHGWFWLILFSGFASADACADALTASKTVLADR